MAESCARRKVFPPRQPHISRPHRLSNLLFSSILLELFDLSFNHCSHLQKALERGGIEVPLSFLLFPASHIALHMMRWIDIVESYNVDSSDVVTFAKISFRKRGRRFLFIGRGSV